MMRHLIGVLTALVILPSVAGAVPVHYIVFEIDANGSIEPVFQRRVELETEPASASPENLARFRQKAADGQEVLYLEMHSASEKSLYRNAIEVQREIRGEFHGLPRPDGGFEIDDYRFAAERPAFVVRTPVRAGAVLEITGAGRASIDLDALESRAGSLRLAHMAATTSHVKSVDKASSANRADFLIMGDGYTAAQRSRFDADATRLTNTFFGISPYREYRSFAKVSRLFTPSAQSGADHPEYQASCNSTTCCTDPAAQSDPSAGRIVDTAFDATYCTANVHRLLTVNTSKVLAAAAAMPAWDQILVLVNDATYGGAGGLLAVASVNESSTSIMQHEVGHSFTRLADEYDTSLSGRSRCRESIGTCEANITDQTQRQQIKWAPWIAGSTPVPTPQNGSFANAVGLFEGGRYFSTGQYRPRDNCLMRSLGVSFGEICSQEYVLRLFQGGFGSPANGIDPIEPGSERPRPGTVDAGSQPLTLSTTVLQPSSGSPIRLQWRVDGQAVPGATSSSLTFAPEQAGTYRVELVADASTTLVHPTMEGGALESSRVWTVTSGGIRPPLDAVFNWQGDQAGQVITFADASTGEPQSWSWDFGDGSTSTNASPSYTFTAPGLYTVTLTVTRDGETASSSRTVPIFDTGPGPCNATASSLCVQSADRFKVEALWRDPMGASDAASTLPFRSADSGLFEFFGADNWELLVKVLDACGINDRFWVFAAATTDVEYVLRITDTNNGSSKLYFNPASNSSPSITDTDAFATCEPGAGASQVSQVLGSTAPQEPSRRASTPPGVACVEDDESFCLSGGRFEVSLTWRDFEGQTGTAQRAQAQSDSSGVMWFFTSNNWELLVKVLDGCSINDRFWVFAAATTNVEYTLQVRDSLTGELVEYSNSLGVASPAITDSGALAVCP